MGTGAYPVDGISHSTVPSIPPGGVHGQELMQRPCGFRNDTSTITPDPSRNKLQKCCPLMTGCLQPPCGILPISTAPMEWSRLVCSAEACKHGSSESVGPMPWGAVAFQSFVAVNTAGFGKFRDISRFFLPTMTKLLNGSVRK